MASIKEKKISSSSDENIKQNLDQKIIIHVMPSHSSLSGVTYSDDSGQNQKTSADNSKKVGLVIIMAGLIIVIAIIYLGYRYLIEPATLAPPPPPPVPVAPIIPPPPPPAAPEVELPLEAEPEPEPSPELLTPPLEVGPDLEVAEEPLAEERAPSASLLNISLLDNDQDGLSDLAEEFITTNPLNPDTDGDGFVDYLEIINGFNPLASGPLTAEFPAIKFQTTGLSFFYPRLWERQTVDDDNWLITAPDQAMIQISRRPNELGQNIFSWYQTEFNLEGVIPSERILSIGDRQGILNQAGTIIYFSSPALDYIFVISYFSATAEDFAHFGPLAFLLDTISF